MKYHDDYIEFVVSKQFEVSLENALKDLELPSEVSRGIERAGGPSELARRLSSTEKLAAEARYHKSLSDVIRLRLLHALSVSEMCPCVLKQIASKSDSKLSYHLKVLESEGLITAKRIKNWRIYSITAKGRRSLSAHKP